MKSKKLKILVIKNYNHHFVKYIYSNVTIKFFKNNILYLHISCGFDTDYFSKILFPIYFYEKEGDSLRTSFFV